MVVNSTHTPLTTFKIRVVQRVPCRPRTSLLSRAYLRTKKDKLGHLLAGL